ncbi:hypothetical protein VARIO8X_150011 [Burkholderiales bacterium 8X]|nr:hypothetical protein VARIO8X_150011 [Burkholderiales bacterium 8X]
MHSCPCDSWRTNYFVAIRNNYILDRCDSPHIYNNAVLQHTWYNSYASNNLHGHQPPYANPQQPR